MVRTDWQWLGSHPALEEQPGVGSGTSTPSPKGTVFHLSPRALWLLISLLSLAKRPPIISNCSDGFVPGQTPSLWPGVIGHLIRALLPSVVAALSQLSGLCAAHSCIPTTAGMVRDLWVALLHPWAPQSGGFFALQGAALYKIEWSKDRSSPS